MPSITGQLSFDWGTIPILGGIVQWTQSRAQDAAAWVVKKYADYVRAKQNLNAQSQDYARAQALVATDPALRPLVAQWGNALNDARAKLNAGDSSVTQIVQWYNSATGQRGMGAFPVVPVAILGILALGAYTITEVIKKVSDAERISMLVRAGMTPDQIARVYRATSGTNRVTSFFANLGVVGTLALVGVGAVVFVPQLRRMVR
jgi:hypothetical protein